MTENKALLIILISYAIALAIIYFVAELGLPTI
jgi:hypothetical protein